MVRTERLPRKTFLLTVSNKLSPEMWISSSSLTPKISLRTQSLSKQSKKKCESLDATTTFESLCMNFDDETEEDEAERK